MPKSKEFIDSSDSDEEKDTTSNNEAKEKESASKKSKAKSTTDKGNDPPAKRSKPNNEDVASTTGPNGERLYEIGKLRYISVSQFKGKPYVNIREYYEDKGVQKPGKKGISLTVEQWEKLKSLIDRVDKDL